mmetsp:Transcript_125407/g.267719  ORF Transcript_125407/g.267719 Transcript_125407/m.267719 type:complete len:211 (-) Transcript_125407:158-790(-)
MGGIRAGGNLGRGSFGLAAPRGILLQESHVTSSGRSGAKLDTPLLYLGGGSVDVPTALGWQGLRCGLSRWRSCGCGALEDITHGRVLHLPCRHWPGRRGLPSVEHRQEHGCQVGLCLGGGLCMLPNAKISRGARRGSSAHIVGNLFGGGSPSRGSSTSDGVGSTGSGGPGIGSPGVGSPGVNSGVGPSVNPGIGLGVSPGVGPGGGLGVA